MTKKPNKVHNHELSELLSGTMRVYPNTNLPQKKTPKFKLEFSDIYLSNLFSTLTLSLILCSISFVLVMNVAYIVLSPSFPCVFSINVTITLSLGVAALLSIIADVHKQSALSFCK